MNKGLCALLFFCLIAVQSVGAYTIEYVFINPQKLDWSAENNQVSVQVITYEPDIQNVSVSFLPPIAIPATGFSNITLEHSGDGLYTKTLTIPQFFTNGFWYLSEIALETSNDTEYFGVDSTVLETTSFNGFAVHYVDDTVPPVLLNMSFNATDINFHAGENVELTITASDPEGYNGIQVLNVQLDCPQYPTSSLYCSMDVGNQYYTPTKTYSCVFSPNGIIYSGIYELRFSLSDYINDVFFFPNTLVAAGYNPYVNITGVSLPSLSAISFSPTILDIRNVAATLTTTLAINNAEGYDIATINLQAQGINSILVDTTTTLVANIIGQTTTLTTTIVPWQFLNANYLVTSVVLQSNISLITLYPSVNTSLTVLAREDYEIPHLDYSFHAPYALHVEPSTVPEGLPTLVNVTFRVYDLQSGFSSGTIIFTGMEEIPFDSSNRISGSIYDGIYSVAVNVFLNETTRCYASIGLIDNAGNQYELGATGYIQSVGYNAICPSTTFANGDYYIESLPFTFLTNYSCGNYTFLLYIKEQAVVFSQYSSNMGSLMGYIETSEGYFQYFSNNSIGYMIPTNGYQRLTVIPNAIGSTVNVTIYANTQNNCNVTCINGSPTASCQCQCNAGYGGSLCERLASCPGNCSNQGYCASDNVCICDSRHSGPNCADCATGLWGPSCKKICPNCVNGKCNSTTGKCDCYSNVQGYLCDTCVPGYGRGSSGACSSKLPQILYIAPTFGNAYTLVLVKGVNLDIIEDVECHFGNFAVNGTVTTETEIQCYAPEVDESTSNVQVVLYSNGQPILSPGITFTYLGQSCGACNSTGGNCFLGVCVCFENYTGAACDILRNAPVIVGNTTTNATEGGDYVGSTLQLENNPSSVQLVEYPTDYASDITLQMQGNDVYLSWADVPYGDYKFVYQATNSFGVFNYSTILHVNEEYSVTGLSITNGPNFFVGDTIRLSGYISISTFDKDVTVKVGNRQFTAYTDLNGQFTFNYVTSTTDIGSLNISAYHYVEGRAKVQTAAVSGFRVDPPESLIPLMTFYYGGGKTTNNNTLYLTNVGGTTITGLTANVSIVTPSLNLSSVKLSAPSSLNSLDVQYVTVSVTANGTVPPTKVLAMFTSGGVSLSVTFTIEVRSFAPLLIVTGNTGNVKQDDQSLVSMTVTNIGGSPSGILSVSLPPDDSGIALVSPLSIPSLLPGQSYTLTFMVTPPATNKRDAASDMISQMIIYSDSTVISTTMRMTPVATINPELTIQVKDEKGLLSGAKVTVTFNGTSQSQSTVEGIATFYLADIGQCDILVVADGHSPSRQTRVISQSQIVTVPLSSTAGSSYTVRYDSNTNTQGTLVSNSGSSNADIAVITPNPSSVNLHDIVTGVVTTLSFTMTNTGSMKAENVSIQMPQINGINFTQIPTVIGDIVPNGFAYVSFLISNDNANVSETCLSAVITYSSTISGAIFNYTASITFNPQSVDCVGGYTGRSGVSPDPSKVTIGVPYPDACLRNFSDLISGFPAFGCPQCFQEKLSGVQVGNIPNQVVMCVLTCERPLPIPVSQVTSLYSQLQDLRSTCKFSPSYSDAYSTISNIYDYLDQISTYLNLFDIIFNDDPWKIVQRDAFWSKLFLNSTTESGDNGILISTDEGLALATYIPSSLSNTITSGTITKFINRWNLSFNKWQEAEFSASNIMDYDAVYTGFQNLQTAQTTAQAMGSLNFVDGLQSAIKQLQANIAKQDLSFLISLESSRSSVIAMDTFTLTMSISSIPSDMSKISVDLQITERYTGKNATDMIIVSAVDINGITGGINGNGAIVAKSTATITWTLQAKNSSSDIESIYSFGGSISFNADGKLNQIPFYNTAVVVYPATIVYVDYFIPSTFPGDDPFTQAVESSSPTKFAMTISNKAGGYLNDLTIASITSSFVDTTGISKIQYQLLDAQVYSLSDLSSKSVAPGFNLDLGNILGAESNAVVWTVVPKFAGKFAKFSTSHKHTDETGFTRATSVVKFTSHNLIKIVQTHDSQDPAVDTLPSFLTDENSDGTPDSVFNGLGQKIAQISNSIAVNNPTVQGTELDVQTGQTGSIYVVVHNPFNATYTLTSVSRGDGEKRQVTNLNPSNFWQTASSINIFDDQSTGSYVLSFTVLQPVPDFSVAFNESNRIGLSWNASTGASVYKLQYKASTTSSYLTISSTILDTSYVVTGLSPATSYTFKVYAGNGIVFEETGATIQISTGASNIICNANMCKNNGSVVAVGGSCVCMCRVGGCGGLTVNSDCSCEQCVATNGTTIDGPCDDGDDCTVGETCSHGVCGGGENQCLADLCDGVVCTQQDCYNVTCVVDSNAPICQSTPLSDGSSCSTGVCQQNQCVAAEVKTEEKTKKSNTGAIVGGVLGGFFGLLIIGAVVAFALWWRKKHRRIDDGFAIELVPVPPE